MNRVATTLLLVLALLMAGSGTAVTHAAPDPGTPCPRKAVPPAPVDRSEEPSPGQPSPTPPPVPATPAGGERMAECGLVLPPEANAPRLPQTLSAWLIHDLDTGEVIAAKDPHVRHRPASLIKTLLALVVIDELPMDRVVVATDENANQECTCAGIVAGGEYTVDQLLHVLLMMSGNDVAHTLATALGGYDTAVGKMNELAARLGAASTHVATPSGLDGPGQMTSAYDMSLIFREAMTKPLYRDAIRTQEVTFPGKPGEPDYPLYNDNDLWDSYPGFLGGKTGFTDDSRHTYAGAADHDGDRLAVVLLRGEQRPVRMSEQAARLLDYGFALTAANAPVGMIEGPGAGQPTSTAGAVSGDGAPAAAEPAGQAPDRFGTTGWVITLFVTLAVGVGLVFAHRRGLIQRAE